jgi:hypothetical protein
MSVQGLILPATDAPTVQVLGFPHPLRGDVAHHELPAGLTIAEMLVIFQPDAFARGYLVVFIGGHRIDPALFRVIRPKAGARIEVKAWVKGAAVLAPLLSIGLSTAAPWVAGTLLGLAVDTIGYAAVVAGVTLLGGLAINALVKPPTPADTSVRTRPGISGARNAARPYGTIPIILGRCRVTPDTVAEPYTEVEGQDVYLRQVFVVGYGPLEISDIRIGDTPISNYDNVDVEVREGYSTDNDMRLFPKVPFTDAIGVKLRNAGGWVRRTTEIDIDEIFVDLEWPQGVADFDNDGSVDNWTVRVNVRYRPVSGGAWVDMADVVVTDYRSRTIRRSRRIKVARGQYEVEVRRQTPDTPLSDTNTRDLVYWTAMRMMRAEDPIQLNKKLAKIAVRIKATDQLNGAIDQLNCIAQSVAKDWDGASWVVRPTRNPASLLRMIAQGPMVRRKRPDARIDLATMEYWAAKCTAAGWNCDAVIADPMSLHDLYGSIAATGRASFISKDSRLSVAIDEAQTVPRQMFTPRNIMSINMARIYTDLPDALRVKFISRSQGYQEDEVIVYNEGKDITNAQTFETLDLWGKTEAKEAAEFGRYWFWTAKLRPETAEIATDVEGLVCAPGHMVTLSHDVLLTGLAWGRIMARTLDGGGNVTAIRLDETCPMLADTDYGVVIRRSDQAGEISRAVVNVPGGSATLTFVDPIPAAMAPVLDDLVSFGEAGRETSNWTVKSIGREDDLYARLTLVPHAPEIHSAAAGEIPDYDPVITVPVEYRLPPQPVIIAVQANEDALELVGQVWLPRIVTTFELTQAAGLPAAIRVIAQFRPDGQDEWRGDDVTVEDMRRMVVRNVQVGQVVDLRLRSLSDTGRLSGWTVVTGVRVTGDENPPADVTGFVVNVIGANARLSWDLLSQPDIAGYRIRHSSLSSGATWGDGVDLSATVPGPSLDVPLQPGSYLIRAVDRGGRLSVNPAVAFSTVTGLIGFNAVEALIEDPGFVGPKDRTMESAGAGGLILSYGYDLLGSPDILAEDWLSGPVTYGTEGWYQFADLVDLGAVFTSRVTAEIRVTNLDLNDDMLSWADLLARDWLGSNVPDVTEVAIEVSVSQDDPSFGNWSAWQAFIAGDFTARAYRFRVRLSTSVPGVTPVVQQLRVSVDMPDRIVPFQQFIPIGGGRILFDPPFAVTPKIGTTVLDGQSGDQLVTSVDPEGLDVEFFDAVGTPVERTLSGLAQAYGVQQS